MGIGDFSTFWGYLEKLKKRHDLTNHCQMGESTTIPDSTVTKCITVFPGFIQNFDVKNIFNYNEIDTVN